MELDGAPYLVTNVGLVVCQPVIGEMNENGEQCALS